MVGSSISKSFKPGMSFISSLLLVHSKVVHVGRSKNHPNRKAEHQRWHLRNHLRQPGYLCILRLLGSYERPAAFRPSLTRGLALEIGNLARRSSSPNEYLSIKKANNIKKRKFIWRTSCDEIRAATPNSAQLKNLSPTQRRNVEARPGDSRQGVVRALQERIFHRP
jgi:hypothetical protein